MTKEQILADLNYASAIAKDGANTPLLGGPIGLMWGCLLIPTLILHGLTLVEVMPIQKEMVGIFWFAYELIGTAFSIFLGRRMERKPGAQSTLNKVGSALGISMGIMIFVLAITMTFTVLQKGLPQYMFNLIIVFAFGIMTVNLAVLARLSGHSYLRNAAIMAGAFMVITLLIVTQDHVYFVAAAGVLVTQIFPSLIEIRNERSNG